MQVSSQKACAVTPLPEALAMGTHCIKLVLMAYTLASTLVQTKQYQDKISFCGSSTIMSSIIIPGMQELIDDEVVTSNPAHIA